jgi:hypothetical protein
MNIYFQTNGFTRFQTDATVQNVNVALTKTLNKLRQEPLNTATTNVRSTPMYAGPIPSRPTTARLTTHQNTGTTTTASNYYYPLPGTTKGPLPPELITRRPSSSFMPNGASHNRVSTGTGPLIVQQPAPPIRTESKANDNTNVRISTPLRAPAKSVETGLRQLDGFNFDNVTLDDQLGRSKVIKNCLKYNLLFFYFLDN